MERCIDCLVRLIPKDKDTCTSCRYEEKERKYKSTRRKCKYCQKYRLQLLSKRRICKQCEEDYKRASLICYKYNNISHVDPRKTIELMNEFSDFELRAMYGMLYNEMIRELIRHDNIDRFQCEVCNKYTTDEDKYSTVCNKCYKTKPFKKCKKCNNKSLLSWDPESCCLICKYNRPFKSSF